MDPFEFPLRCLAVRVVIDEAGKINTLELENLLNHLAGPDQWIMSAEWLFMPPPEEAGDDVTVPVVLPEELAVKAVLSDLTNQPRRIVFDHRTTPAETRRWRCFAFQGTPNDQGIAYFPWERLNV